MALNLTTLQPSTFIGISSTHSSSSLSSCVPKCRKSPFEYTITASLRESRSFPISIDHVTVFAAKPVDGVSRNLSFICSTASLDPPAELELTTGDGGNNGDLGDGSGGDGGGGSGGDGEGEENPQGNRIDCILALVKLGKTMADLPADLASAVQHGRVPASIIDRFFELQTNPVFRWLMQFGGFRERLLADDLFLTKVAIECGVGIFTKSAAELERRRENFSKELDFVLADVVMALIADFMLVWLPAPTVSLAAPISKQAGAIARFFHGCPDNAFQIALNGRSYSLLQRFGAVVLNGSKLLVVGTSASLVGTGVTNALISVRKAIDKDYAGEAEDVPMLPTSLAYGVYMAVSSNLRYQILAGVIEQRILEPLLHKHKLALSATCFAVRTGNTFLGSIMWVDYARWVGVQKIRSE